MNKQYAFVGPLHLDDTVIDDISSSLIDIFRNVRTASKHFVHFIRNLCGTLTFGAPSFK